MPKKTPDEDQNKPSKEHASESHLFDSAIEKTVYEQLLKRGWKSNDILQRQKIFLPQGITLMPDFILLYETYPLAIVEVKGTTHGRRAEALNQVLQYTKYAEVPFGFVTDGLQITASNVTSSDSTASNSSLNLEQFPTPQELWSKLEASSIQPDPRIYPVVSTAHKPRLYQSLAIARTLDSLIEGRKRGIVSLPTGTGRIYVITQLVSKLVQSSYCKRALIISSRLAIAKELEKAFQQTQESAAILDGTSHLDHSNRINITLFQELDSLKHLIENGQNNFDYYDLVVIDELREDQSLTYIISHFSYSIIIGFASASILSSNLTSFFGEPIFSHTLEVQEIDITPPPDYKAVSLKEIADIKRGLSLTNKKEQLDAIQGTPKAGEVYFLAPRDILPDGSINFECASKLNLQKIEQNRKAASFKDYFIEANDILITRIFNPGNIRIALVPNLPSKSAVFSDLIIRIRVTSKQISAKDVYDFLRSATGQILLGRFSTSLAGMPRINASQLSESLIFVPEQQTENNSDELGVTAIAIRQLEENILPLLKTIEDTSCNNSDLQQIACDLLKIASSLAPLPLSERVMNKYPTPIAIAYRRFHDSRFNVYEQVQRLRDVYEATSYFIYNLVFADFLRRLDQNKFFVSNPGARRAYSGYSMSKRIDFIKSIISVAKTSNEKELFTPEIIDSSFENLAEQLKDLRNNLYHTATVTESRQRKILSDSKPIVEDLLSRLEFLENYRLVRIPAFYRKHGRLTYRMEVYQGAVPNLDEQIATDDSPLEELGMAEYDHLVMLNSSGQILDLYPLYQLVDNEETQHETHLCFFKQSKTQDRILEGESIQNSVIVQLGGFDDFSNLVGKIVEQPPGPNI